MLHILHHKNRDKYDNRNLGELHKHTRTLFLWWKRQRNEKYDNAHSCNMGSCAKVEDEKVFLVIIIKNMKNKNSHERK